MSSYTDSTTTSAAAEDQCGYDRITSIHPDIIQTHILNKLDGAALASTGCASSQFLSLCSDEQLWRDICNSTWPSTTDPRILRTISTFPSAHRSFYFDSFPSIHDQLPKKTCLSETSLLISAVDIYYKDQVIYSNASESISTVGHWISLMRIPLKFEGHNSACLSHAEEHLRVSWIMIDPKNKRAVNIASHKAVESRLQGGDIKLRYATVAAVGTGNDPVQCAVLVTCRREEGRVLHVRRVQMHIEDIEGKTLGRRESVGILQAAMQGPRRRIDSTMEKVNYETFLIRKKARHREKQPNWPCVFAVFLIWTAIFFPFLLKYIDLVEDDESWLRQLDPGIQVLFAILTPCFYAALPILIILKTAKVL